MDEELSVLSWARKVHGSTFPGFFHPRLSRAGAYSPPGILQLLRASLSASARQSKQYLDTC